MTRSDLLYHAYRTLCSLRGEQLVFRISDPRRLPIILIVPLMCILLLSGCGPRQGNNGGASGVRTVPVETATAVKHRLSVVKTYSGPLEGEEQANIIARVSERVMALHARVGETVSTGQLVAVLDKSGPSSQYYQASASYRNAEKTLERMKSLYAEGAIAQQALDGAQTQFDVARANFDAARALVELTSPIAGSVTAVNVNVGDLTLPGSALATIATVGRMKIIFNISETDVPNLAIGQLVTVYSEARPGVRLQGKIIQLSKSADSRSRSFEIKALFPNTPDRWFKPGMFCRVDVKVSQDRDVLVIPNAALQSDGVTTTVFLIHDGQAFQRQIQPGVTDGQLTAVLQGLTAGDTVATLGMNNLRDSTAVTVVR
jgi:membrane fusion protein (multidrug efflux system)